jgi:hypothetical protein
MAGAGSDQKHIINFAIRITYHPDLSGYIDP